MATDNEIRIIVTAEVNKALANLNKVKKGGEDTGNFFKKTGDRIKQSWLAISAGVATSAVSIKKAFDFTSEFARFQQATTAMQRQFGKNSDEVLRKLREVSAGTISSAKLIEGANKAMSLNVTRDIDKIAKLLEIARFRAQAMGIETTQAFDDIVTGIGRNSPLILDNLGIITKGWAEEAAAAGVAYDQQFLLNKILQQGAIDIKNAGGVTETAAERLQQFSVSVAEAKKNLGESLLPIFEKILPYVKNFLTGFTLLPSGIKAVGVASFAVVPALVALHAAMGPIGLALVATAAAVGYLVASYGDLKDVSQQELKNQEQKVKNLQAMKIGYESMIANQIEEQLTADQLRNARQKLVDTERKLKDEEKKLSDMRVIYNANTKEAIALEKQLASLQENKQETKQKNTIISTSLDDNMDSKEYEDFLARMKELEEKDNERKEEIENKRYADQLEKEELFEQTLKETRINAMQEWFNASREITNNIFAHRIQAIEAEKQAIDDKVAAGIMTEEQGAKEKKKLDKEIAKEKKKQAIADRVFAISQIAIETAQGIAKAWAFWSPIPGGQIKAARLTALLAGIGVAQTAAVASQPMPQYAMGTDYAPGGPAIINEAGPEMVMLPEGARVIPNYAMGGSVNNSTTTNQNYDNKNITINVQATNFEDFVRQAQERFGRRIFT